jgi:hypothetical protein
MKWTLSQWMALPSIEQEYWLLYEVRQSERLMKWYHKLADEEKNSPEVVTLINMAIQGDM